MGVIVDWVRHAKLQDLWVWIITCIRVIKRECFTINSRCIGHVNWSWSVASYGNIISEWIKHSDVSEQHVVISTFIIACVFEVDLNDSCIWSFLGFIIKSNEAVIQLSLGNILLIWNSIIKVDDTSGCSIWSVLNLSVINSIRNVWQDYQICHLGLLVVSSVGFVLWSILNWKNRSRSDVHIVIFHMWPQILATSTSRAINTFTKVVW